MERLFPPIGQGNFAVEKFDNEKGDISIVFDCGTSSPIDREVRIDEALSRFKEIDKVFISHLDDDHVNGLKYLLRNYRINNVYLPYMTEEERILARLFYRLKSGHDLSEFTAALLNNPRNTIREYETSVTFVRAFNDNESIERSGDNVAQTIASGTQIVLPTKKSSECKWVFIPFNFNQSKLKEQFLNRLRQKGITLGDLSRIIKDSVYWESEYKQLKAVYEEIPGDINTNSMVVYSGLEKCHEKCWKYYCISSIYRTNYKPKICERLSYRCHMEGCLYTGDYNAAGTRKWEQLKKAYKDVWDHIGTITVPHHGSRYSYQPELSRMPVYLVINAGNENPYGHPHDSVLRNMAQNGAYFSWITEDKRSGIVFKLF